MSIFDSKDQSKIELPDISCDNSVVKVSNEELERRIEEFKKIENFRASQIQKVKRTKKRHLIFLLVFIIASLLSFGYSRIDNGETGVMMYALSPIFLIFAALEILLYFRTIYKNTPSKLKKERYRYQEYLSKMR